MQKGKHDGKAGKRNDGEVQSAELPIARMCRLHRV
jgi:hypothetical protein